MTISTTPSEKSYQGDDVSTSFPIPFVFGTSADLKVIRVDPDGNISQLLSGWSASGGNGSTGTLTLSSPLASGFTLMILDDPERSQATSYVSNDAFPAQVQERALDKLTRLVKRLHQRLGRTVRTQDGDPVSDLTLGSVDNRKGKYLFFNVVTGAIEYAVGIAVTTLSQSIIGQLLNPQTPEEAAAGVIPTNYWRTPGHVYRYGINLIPGTTDMTTALQRAINANNVIKLPGATLAFSNLTIPVGRIIEGEGPRKSVLLQITGSTGNAMTFEDANSTDISEGGFHFSNFCIRVATGSHGLYMGAINASMFLTDNFRLVSRQAESLVNAPYATTTGQRGIYVQNDGTGAIYFGTHRNLEIRSFDVGIEAVNTINEWTVHGWIIDCRIAVRLNGCSTWDLSGVTVESAVSAARALQTFNAVSNIRWLGGRWELTRPTSEGGGCYGMDGDGSTTGGNWRFEHINVLISGDGGAIPGRKWTGTIPADTIYIGYDASPLPFLIIPNLGTFRLPNLLTLGGTGLGNALITLGRNSGGAACSIGHDGTHLEIKAGNSMELFTGGTLPAATLDDTVAAGNTRLLLYDVNKGALSRVSVGANDSGGSGFKLLRVPN